MKQTMTIVGFGRMGKRFTKLFALHLAVTVYSSRNISHEVGRLNATYNPSFEESISLSKYILLAVPINVLDTFIERLNKVIDEKSIVIDCCSARISAEEKLSKLKCKHFGIHDIKSNEFCIIGDAEEEIIDILKSQDIGIRVITAEEHDRLNSIIGLGHFVGLSLDSLLTEDEKEVLSGIGSGSLLIQLMDRLRANSSTTWKETQIDNPFTKARRESLIKTLVEYDKKLSQGEFPFVP